MSPGDFQSMEAVTILRELWRRRILVAVVAVASVLAGLAISYHLALPPESRKFDVGIASGRILVDTPDSQVVDVSPKGSGTLGLRASVVANLMTEGEVKATIARDAGLRPDQLRAGVEVEGELPVVLSSASGDPNAHLLTTRPAVNPDGAPLPMIDIEAQAPNTAAAARIANAAVSGLNDYLDSKAAGEDVPDARRLQVTGFGAPQVRQETRGPRNVVALAVGLFVFVAGCAAILLLTALARAWKVAAEQESDLPAEPGSRRAPLRERFSEAFGRGLAACRRLLAACGRLFASCRRSIRTAGGALRTRRVALSAAGRRTAVATGPS